MTGEGEFNQRMPRTELDLVGEVPEDGVDPEAAAALKEINELKQMLRSGRFDIGQCEQLRQEVNAAVAALFDAGGIDIDEALDMSYGDNPHLEVDMEEQAS